MSNLLEQASLVMIPSGYKEDIVYSEIPINGAGDLSFTRASNGTRINSQGLVEVCPWNLCTYSEQFQNTDWIGGGNGKPTMTDNFAEAPNGTMTASKIIAASDGYQLRQNNAQENTQMNLSVWLRTNTGTKTIQLFLNNGNTASQNITVTTTWTRYEISGLVTTLSGSGRNGLSTAEALTSSNYILVWGFQLSVGLTAKPYFPTTDRLNVPRLTYQNGGGGCPSLLLEKQSTNLITYSEQFDNAVHYKLDVTITANNITSPDGTQNADKFTETTGTGEHIVYDIDSNATGTYTLSAFFKGGAGTIYPVLRLNGSSTTAYAGCIFNTSTGAIVNTFYNTYSAPITKVENMGNGWYRVSMTTTTTDANFGMRIAASNSTSPSIGAFGAISYTGSTSNYFYAYGAQLEASSYATSYIPTTSSSATRVADLSTTSTIQTAQTFAGDFTMFADFVPFIDSTDANGMMVLGGGASGLGSTYQSYLWFSGSNVYLSGDGEVVIITRGYSMVVNQRVKIAITRVGTTVKMFVNGAQVGASATSSLSITIRSIGWSYNLPTYQTKGKINQILLSATGASDADAISLTTI